MSLYEQLQKTIRIKSLSSRLFAYAIWLLLCAEMLFLLLPRTVLDLRVIGFFISANDQPAFEGQVLGTALLSGMMAIELFGVFALWWLALRCMKTAIKDIPPYIWIGIIAGIVSMLNFILPILWTLVSVPLFWEHRAMGKLQIALPVIVVTTFAVMYWRGKLAQGGEGQGSPAVPAGSDIKDHNPKFGKKWQRGLIAIIAISTGVIMLTTAKPQAPLTLEQATSLSFRVSVKGIPFDIPVNYHYNEYSYFKKWPQPTQGEIDGTERRAVDVIKVTALLPDMAPYTSESAAEFEKRGGGKTVRIMFRERGTLDLLNSVRDQKKIKNSKLPGMLQYEALSRDDDEFFSPDYSINIRCDNKPAAADWFPHCKVLSPYRHKSKTVDTAHPEFYFDYSFPVEYLLQWREIDEQVQALFDRFAASAQHH